MGDGAQMEQVITATTATANQSTVYATVCGMNEILIRMYVLYSTHVRYVCV